MQEQVFTNKQVAFIAQVTTHTVNDWKNKGVLLPSYPGVLANNKDAYSMADVEKAVNIAEERKSHRAIRRKLEVYCTFGEACEILGCQIHGEIKKGRLNPIMAPDGKTRIFFRSDVQALAIKREEERRERARQRIILMEKRRKYKKKAIPTPPVKHIPRAWSNRPKKKDTK